MWFSLGGKEGENQQAMALQLSESLTINLCSQIGYKLHQTALVTGLEIDHPGVINLVVQHFCPMTGNTQEFEEFIAALASILKAQEAQGNED